MDANTCRKLACTIRGDRGQQHEVGLRRHDAKTAERS